MQRTVIVRMSLWIVLALSTCGVAVAIEPSSKAVAVDEKTALRANDLFNAGRLVEAEPLYRAILAAVDAGSLPHEELGHCLGPLVKIYLTWGRNEDALRIAERYRKFLQNATKLDAKVRREELDKVSLELINILAGLARYTDAERELAVAIETNQTRQPPDVLRRLLLLEKSAQLADAESDKTKARDRWSQVVLEGQSDTARIERRELPADALPDVAAAVTRADEALEDYPAAIAVQRKLLDRHIARQDRPAELRTRAEIGRLDVANRDFAAARDELTLAIAQARKMPGGSVAAADLLVQLAQVGTIRDSGARPDSVGAKQRPVTRLNSPGSIVPGSSTMSSRCCSIGCGPFTNRWANLATRSASASGC